MTALPRVFRDKGFVSDVYVRAGDDDLPAKGDVVLVSVTRWDKDGLAFTSGEQRVGVFVDPADIDDDRLPHLLNAPVIAIDFPKFTDGRGYSVARMLRDQLGFEGELLATGDVLIDQVPLMVRCGFSAFSVSHEPTARALADGSFKGIDHVYQSPVSGQRWQRRSRGRAAPSEGVQG